VGKIVMVIQISEPKGDVNSIAVNAQILIIDDESEICEEISEKLEFHGFHCLTAINSKSGLKLLRVNTDISVVLTDIRMPGMSGLEMCEIIGSEVSGERDLALLVMTGHAGLSEAIEAIKVGALDFLTKPLAPDLLVHAVKRADQHIKARRLERNFNEQLTAQVGIMTNDLQQKSYELEKSNTALVISNQVKDEFMTMISHELRTPLNVIVGLAQIINLQGGDPKINRLIKKVEDAGWKLTDMVNSIMDMVAIDTKDLQLKMSEVDILKLVEKSIFAYKGKAIQAGVTIKLDNIVTSKIMLDSTRISQAIGHILDNAIKFSRAGSVIQVSSKQDIDSLTITIRDNGVGMSQTDISKALKPLSQVDGSLTKDHGGIGMGLSLAKMFVELHGGSLTVSSKLEYGTTIILLIPVINFIAK
jgi:signal transduction histidine kinase